jgi:hypothetical protein
LQVLDLFDMLWISNKSSYVHFWSKPRSPMASYSRRYFPC